MKHFYMAALVSCTILSACSSSNSNDVGALEERNVTIAFAAEANNVAIDCTTQLTGIGNPATNAAIREFRFYIHDVTLLDDQGNTFPLELEDSQWTHQNLALLDFMDKDTSCSGAAKEINREVTGTVSITSQAQLAGLQFTLGVPSELNHNDRATAPAPLDQTSLHWNWQNGYKFARLDVAPVGGITRPSDPSFNAGTWNFHLGSTNCVGDPQTGDDITCDRPNRPIIQLDNFDAEADTVTLDFGALVTDIDLTQDLGGKPGCMGGATDPECLETFKALGLDVSTGKAEPTLTQTVFRVN
jgi:uncharacterized repeat protein (TIGR04052 family)